jgi:hypothetical protein
LSGGYENYWGLIEVQSFTVDVEAARESVSVLSNFGNFEKMGVTFEEYVQIPMLVGIFLVCIK